MAQQLTFDLPAKPALGRDAFFVSPANAAAVLRLEHWRDWPGRRLALCGAPGTGKTHLAHVWAAQSGAVIIGAGDLIKTGADALSRHPCLVLENAEAIAGDPECEAAVFHLYNLLQAADGFLLLTATRPPAHWPILLPDLKSRLQTLAVTYLEAPDDALLSALLLKLFADRQITVTPALVAYLVARIERSAVAAGAIVAALDEAALQRKCAVTRRLAAELLDKP